MKKIIILVFSLILLLGIFLVIKTKRASSESKELTTLKSLLDQPFHPQWKHSVQGNIRQHNLTDESAQEAFSIIAMSKSPDLTPWLEENISHYSPYFLYAMVLRTAREQNSLEKIQFWQWAANLRAMADRSLCKDKWVGQYNIILNRQIYSLLEQQLPNKDIEKMTDLQFNLPIMRKVVEWDIKNSQTNAPDWFCKSGHAGQTEEIYPVQEWEKRRKDFKKQYTLSAYEPYGLKSPY